MPKGKPAPTVPGPGDQPALSQLDKAADQRRRFEEAARELGCDDGEALDVAFGKIVPPKLPNRSGRD